MQENQHASSPVNRIVIVLGILSMIGMLAFGVFWWRIANTPVEWYYEAFGFDSGGKCCVFQEPKLAIFLGDGETEEVFDRIGSHSSISRITVNGNGHSTSTAGYFSIRTQSGKMTMESLDGKCTMVVSRHGTRLTLADGRKFRLDGQTPLWLRCKLDGTIVQLNELPEGFVEFFESPPPEPGLVGSIKSWPEAFRQTL